MPTAEVSRFAARAPCGSSRVVGLLEILRDAHLDERIVTGGQQVGHINPQQGVGEKRRYDPDAGTHIDRAYPIILAALFGKGLKGTDVGE